MKVFFLTLLLLMVTGLQAQESLWDINQLKSKMEFEVELVSVTMRVGHEISEDLKKEGITTEAQLQRMNNDKLAELVSKKAMIFAQTYESHWLKYDKDFKGKGLLKRYLSQLEWKEIVPILKSSMIGLKGFFKDKGAGTAIAIGLGMACEYVSYFALSVLSLPQLIPIAMATPFGTIFSTIPSTFNYFQMRSRMIKTLGGLDSYHAYKKQRQLALKELLMRNPNQILFPVTQTIEGSDSLQSVVLNKRSFWAAIKIRLGLNVRGLNYPNLKLFLLLNNIELPSIDYIMEANGLPYYVKTGLISQIILSKDDKIKEKFIAKFGDHIVTHHQHGNHVAIRKWTETLLENPNTATIRELMADLPDGVEPKMAAEIWEQLIIPHYATKFDLSYSQFRNLKKQSQLFKASVFKEPNIDKKQFFSLFDEIITKNLEIEIPRCSEPEKFVLRYLLGRQP